MTYLPNGAIAAQLDESFMDAITVTRDADGSHSLRDGGFITQADKSAFQKAAAKSLLRYP